MDLSDAIREWLSSSRLTYTTQDMNRRLGIRGARKIIIPQLVMELVMGEMDPRDFVAELSHRLNLSPSSAKIIAKEIEEKMLHPIERDLKIELGIDVGLLHFPAEESLSAKRETPIVPEGIHTTTPTTILPLGGGEEKAKEMPSSGPLILHAEQEPVKPPVVPPRPTFSIRIPLSQKKYTPSAPIRARIETGEESPIANRQAPSVPEKTPTQPSPSPRGRASPLPPLGPLSSLSGINKPEKSLPLQVLPLGKGEEIPPLLKEVPEGRRILEKEGKAPNPFVKKVVNYSEWRTPLE